MSDPHHIACRCPACAPPSYLEGSGSYDSGFATGYGVACAIVIFAALIYFISQTQDRLAELEGSHVRE